MSAPVFLKQGLAILLRRQTNILSAALVIMVTVVLSQLLGLIRQRLLVAEFGASNILGVYLASSRLPDLLFQIIIAGALSSAFIPVFSEFLVSQRKEEGYRFASSLLILFIIVFSVIASVIFIFSPFFAYLTAPGFSPSELSLMANLMRIILFGEILFLLGSFFSALLQSFNHFFIPGIAAATYNLGIIIGILVLTPMVGIFAPAYGVLIGGILFILVQIPLLKIIGFRFTLAIDIGNKAMHRIFMLMWPRTISLGIFQIGSLITVTLISLLSDPGRKYVLFDYAQTLAFAPVSLFGQTMAQAAFPILSRERERLNEFCQTFLTSFSQLLYLVMPFSVLFIVLRIPVVRLVYGASQFDWEATVLTGKLLAWFTVGLFAQALTYLVARAFYALYDTKTPLIIGGLSTLGMLGGSYVAIIFFHFDVQSLAVIYSIAGIIQLIFLVIFLQKRTGPFLTRHFLLFVGKILIASLFMGIALYVPIKVLDKLVFDTTKTINLIVLTGISSTLGLFMYLFLTWLLRVQEASMFLVLFKRLGNWRSVLTTNKEMLVSSNKSQS